MPAVRPLTVVDEVLPVVVTPPGLRVSVQVPDGNPLSTTEPVATEQVGCVTFPRIVGTAGVFGCASIVIILEALEGQPFDVAVMV